MPNALRGFLPARILTTTTDADGNALDAKVELQEGAIILHGRGGAFGKPNLRNPDYRKALRATLEPLAESDLTDALGRIDRALMFAIRSLLPGIDGIDENDVQRLCLRFLSECPATHEALC